LMRSSFKGEIGLIVLLAKYLLCPSTSAIFNTNLC
jgi:hypothetical protein